MNLDNVHITKAFARPTVNWSVTLPEGDESRRGAEGAV